MNLCLFIIHFIISLLQSASLKKVTFPGNVAIFSTFPQLFLIFYKFSLARLNFWVLHLVNIKSKYVTNLIKIRKFYMSLILKSTAWNSRIIRYAKTLRSSVIYKPLLLYKKFNCSVHWLLRSFHSSYGHQQTDWIVALLPGAPWHQWTNSSEAERRWALGPTSSIAGAMLPFGCINDSIKSTEARTSLAASRSDFIKSLHDSSIWRIDDRPCAAPIRHWNVIKWITCCTCIQTIHI